MSSLVRRLTIRMMQRAGYTREKWVIEKDASGNPKLRNVKRGGEITDADDTPIGRIWPAIIPARARAPSKPQKKVDRAPRGRRRGTPHKQFIARKARGQ